jgi:formate dehydrogenase major subunit
VSWDEAMAYAAASSSASRPSYGRDAVGGITSSRCTNEETYLVQKLVRAAFGNNNVDTCARVCHSPTGYGLKQTLGESAGTQDLRFGAEGRRHHGDRRQPDRRPPGVRLADEARLREGAKLIVVDPRASTWCARRTWQGRPSPQADAGHQRRTGSTRWRTSSSPKAWSEAFVAERCEWPAFEQWREFVVALPRTRPRPWRRITGVPAEEVRAAARLFATAGNGRHLLRPRRHRAQPGLDHRDGHRQPGHGHRQHRPPKAWA